MLAAEYGGVDLLRTLLTAMRRQRMTELLATSGACAALHLAVSRSFEGWRGVVRPGASFYSIAAQPIVSNRRARSGTAAGKVRLSACTWIARRHAPMPMRDWLAGAVRRLC